MDNIDNLIQRARNLLCYCEEEDVLLTFIDSGTEPSVAFFAVKAAIVLGLQLDTEEK